MKATLEPRTLEQARQKRDLILENHEANAGRTFINEASAVIMSRLRTGEASSEDLVDACKENFIIPHDDRAFGTVFANLSRAGKIEKAGYCQRRKGHATSGGIVWRIKHGMNEKLCDGAEEKL